MKVIDLDVQLDNLGCHLLTKRTNATFNFVVHHAAQHVQAISRDPTVGYWQRQMKCDSLRDRVTVYSFLKVVGTT